MTMQITMKQTRLGESGTLLNAGSSYTVSDAFGASMVGTGFATDPAGALSPGREVPVMGKFNTVTGGIELSAGGEPVVVGGGGVTLPPLSLLVGEGDSITAAGTTASWLYALANKTNGYFSLGLGYNKAVGGQTAAQTALDAQITDVNSALPRVVCYLAGTNDISSSATSSRIITAIRKAVQGYLRGGADYVLVSKILPRVGLSVENQARLDAVNDGIANMGTSNIIVVDVPVGFSHATDTTDGLHPNWSGIDKLAGAFAEKLELLKNGKSFDEYYNSTFNLIKLNAANWALTGTAGSKGGGNITGQVADSWTVWNSSTCTVVCSKVVEAGIEKQVINIVGTATAGASVRLSVTVNQPVVIGDLYEGCWDVEVLPGQVGFNGLAASVPGLAASPGGQNLENAAGWNGKHKTGVTAAASASAASINPMIDVRFGGSAGMEVNITVKISKPVVVLLGQA